MQVGYSFFFLQHTFCAVPKLYTNVSNTENNLSKLILDFLLVKLVTFCPLWIHLCLKTQGNEPHARGL